MLKILMQKAVAHSSAILICLLGFWRLSTNCSARPTVWAECECRHRCLTAICYPAAFVKRFTQSQWVLASLTKKRFSPQVRPKLLRHRECSSWALLERPTIKRCVSLGATAYQCFVCETGVGLQQVFKPGGQFCITRWWTPAEHQHRVAQKNLGTDSHMRR